METNTLGEEMLRKMDAYWRAANYLSVGRIYPDVIRAREWLEEASRSPLSTAK